MSAALRSAVIDIGTPSIVCDVKHAGRLETAGPHVAQRHRLALKQGYRRPGGVLPGDSAASELRLQRLHHVREEDDRPSLSELERVLSVNGQGRDVVQRGLNGFQAF